MYPPKNKNGASFSKAAVGRSHAKAKRNCQGGPVKTKQVSRWLDDAIAMCQRAASDPAELRRLGIWLARIRRALP